MLSDIGITMNETRTHFFDNFRLLIVLCVVLMHSSAAYGIYTSWWYVHDIKRHIFFDIFITAMDLCLMPSLFFIAGYFTLQSMNRVGPSGFIKKKLSRIALPWAIGMLFYVPLLPFLSKLNTALMSNITPEWYGKIWMDHMKNISSIRLGPFVNTQEHFWFLSLLFYFFYDFFGPC
jgi:fucose 4-O-acetylase-like acetyltransferase